MEYKAFAVLREVKNGRSYYDMYVGSGCTLNYLMQFYRDHADGKGVLLRHSGTAVKYVDRRLEDMDEIIDETTIHISEAGARNFYKLAKGLYKTERDFSRLTEIEHRRKTKKGGAKKGWAN